jgi:hypothetical protein
VKPRSVTVGKLRVHIDANRTDRATLEAAHDAAANIGPSPGILPAALLPPLPHSADLLAAKVAVAWPPPVGARWVEIDTMRTDGRAPWRMDQMSVFGSAQRVTDGSVLILPFGGPHQGGRRH